MIYFFSSVICLLTKKTFFQLASCGNVLHNLKMTIISTLPYAHGWLIIDKPLYVTSSHVVHRIKRKFGKIKVGHAGTLDPLATGILPIALGEATKTVPYVVAEKKRYQFEVTWGEERSTDDAEGEVLTKSLKRPSKDHILCILNEFEGEILQTPPLYSAIKVKGERAYTLMRSQKAINLPPRPIKIFSFILKRILSVDKALFEVETGKGAYVRALARDMGRKLGCYGYASMITRLSVGKFEKKHAIPLEKLAYLEQNVILREYVKAIPAVLDDIPAVYVSEIQAQCLRQGQGIASGSFGLAKEQEGAILLALGSLQKPIALVRYHEKRLHPERVFNL
jgi:tRNA pseudouridine55 synthase